VSQKSWFMRQLKAFQKPLLSHINFTFAPSRNTMNSLITTSFTFIIILVIIFFTGCKHSQTPNNSQISNNSRNSTMDESTLPVPNSLYVKVYVTKSGEITLDGKQTTLKELEIAFASLAQKKGVVLYTRESPEENEPHQNALQVVKLITQNKLPVRLCRIKDCSDAFDEKGKLKINN
jgi:biopolymer transport protein ExbD